VKVSKRKDGTYRTTLIKKYRRGHFRVVVAKKAIGNMDTVIHWSHDFMPNLSVFWNQDLGKIFVEEIDKLPWKK
jgi:hypothetical protein